MLNYLTFGLIFFFTYIATSRVTYGQVIPDTPIQEDEIEQIKPDEMITVPPSQGQTITEIRVRFVDKDDQPVEGKTRPEIIQREFKLKPGDVYNSELAKTGLAGVNNLIIVKRASLSLEPSTVDNQENEVVMVVKVEENNQFFFTFGLTLNPPTALQGSARPVTVLPISNRPGGFGGGVRFGLLNLGGTNKAISLGVEGGEKTLGLDLDYRDFFRHDRGFAANINIRQGVETEFDGGDNEVDLPNGSDPWVYRFGGGVEYFFPLTRNFQGALGVSYRVVSVRDGLFAKTLQPVDEEGNSLTFSNDGQDTLLTINFASALDKRDNSLDPSEGYRLLFGVDQSIPVGDANILYSRLAANYTQYVPLPLFGFTQGNRTFVFNLQGGTLIGDLPPYEAFTLGGGTSVRGYSSGEVGTGRSFIQSTVEYRFPIANFNAFKDRYNLAGSLFVDYATDLGSGDTFKGEPAIVRDKPGSGLGYGLGLRLPSRFGTLRLEFALNDQGESAVYFNIGDRF